MEQLGPLTAEVETTVADLVDRKVVERTWAGDHTVWQEDPTEVADRLGWLHVAPEVLADRERLDTFASTAAADGLTHVVVMGMGGSSLFPEVLARTFPPAGGRPELRVLDTTDPAAVARIGHECPDDATLFLASSKSGSTIETRSHLETFWARIGRPEQFAVVTDPGSALAELAAERGFRATFENRPDIGGRY
jgi:glucose-6-phosphate isomerase